MISGGSTISPHVSRVLLEEFKNISKREKSRKESICKISELSFTEKETLTLLYKGYSRDGICEYRGIEISTIKTQIRSILKKFNMKNTKQVIQFIKDQKLKEYLE